MASTDPYMQRVGEIANNGSITVGISLGQKLGLFTILSKQESAISPEQLSRLSKCKKALVETWLLLMTSADIVTMSGNHLFFLPPERRPALTKTHSAAVFLAPYIPYMEKECMGLAKTFKDDQSDESAAFEWSMSDPDDLFVEWQKIRPSVFKAYFTECTTHIPCLDERLKNGAKVLDVGTNDGRFVNMLAEQYPKTDFIGVDINEDAIKKIVPSSPNASFMVQDALNLPAEWKDRFDYVTIIDAFQHLPDTNQAAKEFARVLKPGGWLSVIEIKRGSTYEEDMKLPNAVFNYLFEMMWCGESCGSSDAAKEAAHPIPNALHLLKQPISQAGFSCVKDHPLQRIDLDDTVHICCQK
ncbi:hypothetical protein CAPTEDRAFT_217353 [Capitella teleta]|uniref:Methyltransferase domain-containing protein n=1 Tax=Capitella teleta TaxID=283909 RepID=R7UFY4_CAPTE|nr:hypothetical protein CAPTEDRAFT_217173 [Capitella teleta]ELU02713.1 hypothetical protein CAPTEDRAFT_217353 [Capitella teleta]|eukprot:ELT96977.1 hypothetical protein CAPTEDRAFT_217173 [Capitella teleta]